MRRITLSVALLFAITALPALAQEAPPARVGRISFVSGQLAFHGKGETSWSAASVNYPVATGESFWADPQSRAEIRVGAQTISLSGNTEVDIVKLDQQVMQLGVPQGRVELQIRSLTEGNTVEIDLPHGGVWLLQPGIYDIDAGAADRPARIAALDGSARFVGGGVDIAVKTGDVAVLNGTQTLTASLEHAAPDAFAEWCRSRDYHLHRLASPYHVSPRMTGYAELDAYGTWRSVPQYGEVWYPSSVAVGWAPYRDGRWVWVAPWGWTWVDAAPWGFAPFHYGRWAYTGGAWGWVPGAFVAAPVYAPALVGFIANPAVILASAVAGPVVGWFPLGPGEAYWPSYSNDPLYIRALNTGAVRDSAHLGPRPTGRDAAGLSFANRAATTVVPQRAFASAHGVASSTLRVSDRAVQHAQVTAQAPSIRPAAAHGWSATAGRRGSTGQAAFHGGGGRARFGREGGPHGGGHAAFHGGGGRARFGREGGPHGAGHAAFHGGGGRARFGREGGPHGGGHAAFHGGGGMAHGGGPHGGGRAAFGGGGGGDSPHGGPHGGGGMAHGGGKERG